VSEIGCWIEYLGLLRQEVTEGWRNCTERSTIIYPEILARNIITVTNILDNFH
jgi:hypothetical protein